MVYVYETPNQNDIKYQNQEVIISREKPILSKNVRKADAFRHRFQRSECAQS